MTPLATTLRRTASGLDRIAADLSAEAAKLRADALARELSAIRAAHDLPASAASSAAPPADAPPCSAGLTAGAFDSSDAPALSGGA